MDTDTTLRKPVQTKTIKPKTIRTLGPVSDLERHLPSDWWKTLFNALYLKTDGDVVENDINTSKEIDLLIAATGFTPEHKILDLCCGQGRHILELARRGFKNILGIDRSRYLIRMGRKRAKQLHLDVQLSEGDARKIRLPESSVDCVALFGNSFGYFEHKEDDITVLKGIKRILKSDGILVLDIVDGEWLRNHFEARTWEWVDQNHFVCRERSLSADLARIVSREVIVHAERGVIADQFYAERLYTALDLKNLLQSLGFNQITTHPNVQADSLRGQDLGMMANRIFLTAMAPPKPVVAPKVDSNQLEVTVILGDPRISSPGETTPPYTPEDLEAIQKAKQALRSLKDYKFTFLDNHALLINQLITTSPAFVLNLCDDGFSSDALKELHIPALLDLLNIPYTGAGAACLAMCYNKSVVRAVAASVDIPVPLETYFDPSDQAASLPSIFPAILKPNFGDGSIGITQQAVVHNAEGLVAYLETLRTTLPNTPILIQEYLTGTEYSVGVIGNPGRYEILPILEVDYSKLPPELPKILGYESKWIPGSPYWDLISYHEAQLDADMARRLSDYAILLFERLGCQDYARCDFRADAEGTIKLLEVNPNPAWCWDGKLNLMAGFRGQSYSDLLEMLLNAARDRIPKLKGNA